MKIDDVSIYLEILFESVKSGRGLRQALCDVGFAFSDESEDKKRMEQALQYAEESRIKDAFACVLQGYPCKKLEGIHKFLPLCVDNEKVPCEVLDYIMDDFEFWKKRQKRLDNQKNEIKRQRNLVLFLPLLLCLLSSFVTSFISCVMGVKRTFISVIMIAVFLLFVLFFMWVTIAIKKMMKSEEDEILQLLSYWLYWVGFSIEERGIYQTLLHSFNRLEGAFLDELEMLMENIRETPTSKEPYEKFFEKIKISQMRRAIRLLAGANFNGYTQTKHELMHLMKEYQIESEQLQKKKDEAFMFRMHCILQIPFALLGLKILWDAVMTFLLISGQMMFYSGG